MKRKRDGSGPIERERRLNGERERNERGGREKREIGEIEKENSLRIKTNVNKKKNCEPNVRGRKERKKNNEPSVCHHPLVA